MRKSVALVLRSDKNEREKGVSVRKGTYTRGTKSPVNEEDGGK